MDLFLGPCSCQVDVTLQVVSYYEAHPPEDLSETRDSVFRRRLTSAVWMLYSLSIYLFVRVTETHMLA